MSEPDSIEWPREIWMAEREDHDQGVVSAVLSEHATVARFEGDKERDREFHRYVDGDIFDSQAKYYAAERERLSAQVERLKEALTPSAETKRAYIGEFSVRFPVFDDDGNECFREINVPWTTIKEVMKAISGRGVREGE